MLKTVIISFLFCINLCADIEYDITLLAPKGQELNDGFDGYHISLNEAGYVWGSISSECECTDQPFVYHQSSGFQLISLPEKFENPIIKSVNAKGIAVGVGGNSRYYWESSQEFIFIYDTKTATLSDLSKSFPENIFVHDLIITDENKIIFNSDDHTYVYDIKAKNIQVLPYRSIAMNAKGQILGDNWFLDPKEGFFNLGSLDQFNRWDVEAEVLSPNGYVAGTGQDSFDETKGFVWNKELGLHAFDVSASWLDITAVNDQGQVVGSCSNASYYSYYGYGDNAFLYSQELGFTDLGTLGRGRMSTAYSINNHGQVVGASDTTLYGKERAFIWDADHEMRDLTTLIPKNIGWTALREAFAINDAGLIIGHGSFYGVDQYFLLTPIKK